MTTKKSLSFADVVLMFRKEYEKAKDVTYVKKPLSFALYNTWQNLDKKEKERKIK